MFNCKDSSRACHWFVARATEGGWVVGGWGSNSNVVGQGARVVPRIGWETGAQVLFVGVVVVGECVVREEGGVRIVRGWVGRRTCCIKGDSRGGWCGWWWNGLVVVVELVVSKGIVVVVVVAG